MPITTRALDALHECAGTTKNLSMSKNIFFSAYFILFTCNAFACKDRAEVLDYPINELKDSSIVVEAKVTNIEQSTDGGYPATKSFKATILQSFKGNLTKGKIVRVFSSKEEVHAVCPVLLKEGKTYILVLRKNGKSIETSRFNIVIDSENENYPKFIGQIKSSVKS